MWVRKDVYLTCICSRRVVIAFAGRLHHLQERMKPVMTSEVEVVVQEERSAAN